MNIKDLSASDRGKFIVFLLVWIIFSANLTARNTGEQSREDSLQKRLLHTVTPHERIPLLKELAHSGEQGPNRPLFLTRLAETALEADSFYVAAGAMVDLCRYYYFQKDRKHLICWVNRINKMCADRKESPGALFKAGSFLIRFYLSSGDFELAMNEAIRLHSLAGKENSSYGKASTYHLMGLISQKSYRDSSAMEIFRKGLDILDNHLEDPVLEVEFLSDMIISDLRTGDIKESLLLVNRMESVLNEPVNALRMAELIYPPAWYRLLIHIYYMDLYIRKGELEKASRYREKIMRKEIGSTGQFLKLVYLKAEAHYHQLAGHDRLALAAINESLQLDRSMDMLKMKVDVLRSLGDLEEAIHVYDEVLMKSDSIDNDAFTRQMGQLRLLTDLNNRQKEAELLQAKEEQIIIRQRLLFFFILLSFVLLVLLYGVGRLYRGTNRLQKELKAEKDSLVESERQLRVIKEKAVEANRLKSAFISNISHEVRTPLNAIVGFSELLTEEEFEEDEKAGFASTINHSSELLLNLINDVLELSRLESSRAAFSFKSVELTDCCRQAMASVAHRVAPGVRLLFRSSVPAFQFITDPLRLQQLLGHLLSNAVKFTKEGEILLTYETDDDKQEVRFSVTDTGCGIQPDMQQKIFERFEKVDEFMQGTGLGLSICKIIADRLQGSLGIDPDYTEGARFIFIHPYHIPVEH